MNMLAEERRQKILERVNADERNSIQVSELTRIFGVTGMTIRRDLEILAKEAKIRRVHGGAVGNAAELTSAPFSERRKEFINEKRKIGKLAAELIHEGDRIALDSGTTTMQIARNLGSFSDITVVTNGLSVAAVLSQIITGKLIMLGGEVRLDEMCVIGSVPANQVSQYNFDKAFIGTAGFSLEKGVTDSLLPEAEVKSAMIRSAREVILVADSSKWNIERFIRVAELKAFHKIISDEKLDKDVIKILQEQGIEVLIADN
jgi:DeoR family transcriptional regulator, fructose operon transcriptional repressor